jgi:hypothetical protein
VALLGRIIVIIVAVTLAMFAAGIAIAFGLLGPEWHGFSGDVVERGTFSVFVVAGTAFTGAVTLLPLAILIAVAEIIKVRSFLVYAVAGAVLMLMGYSASGLAPPSYEESIDNPPPPISHGTQVAAAAGIVFGGVYWLIAGRKAGRWREPRQPSA